MSGADEGACVVREYRGVRANVLVYRRRCDACGYLAPRNSFAVALVIPPYADDASYDTEAFYCPLCANHQAVRIGSGSGNREGSLASIGALPIY